jgi:poly(3-hydroxyalkanoate) synthetase
MVAQRHHRRAGVSKHNEQAVTFITRQLLDMWSPSNIPFLNPEIVQTTIKEGGANLIRGWQHFIDDAKRAIQDENQRERRRFRWVAMWLPRPARSFSATASWS